MLPPVDEWDNINVPVVTSLNAGETGTMKSLSNSLSSSEKMTVTSSNENVAKIENNKTIRALSPGKTRITTLIESKENTKSFSFDLKVNESPLSKVELPEVGTKLSDMSFAQIQRIAREGKTADYGIKIGDTIKVNDTIEAQVISIGDDYIEFITTKKIVEKGYSKQIVVNYGSIRYNEITSFYTTPQVSNGITNTAQISYVGSNIQTQVEKTLDEQSDEFKSSLKEVERVYDVATLTYDGGNHYSQIITDNIKDIEKVYIPTKTELENINTFRPFKYYNGGIWSATPYTFASNNSAYSFGYFYYSNCGSIGYDFGCRDYDIIAMFRIG